MVVQLPYHPGLPQPEEALASPEILAINALLCLEEFRPAQYGLDKEMLSSHDKLWQFCLDYQAASGRTPPRELVARMFPAFEQVEPVDIHWAADLLRAKHHENTIRRTLQKALSALHDGEMEQARELISDAARPALMARPKAMSIYDPDSLAGSQLKSGWREPWPALQEATGGVGRGEVRTVAARYGEGKTWVAPVYAVHLAEQGARVCILTCEVPKKVYIRRTQLIVARDMLDVQRELKSADEQARIKALGRLPFMDGAVEVLDPSDVRMTTKAVDMAALDYDVVIIDHVGLMHDGAGRPFVEDWRVAATISHRLKEIALEQDVSIISMAQLNREGQTTKGKASRSDKIGGTDALGQDSDVLQILKRITENGPSMLHDIPKNRGGFSTRFYTAFAPQRADFRQITKDVALDLAREHEARTDDS